jgi:hypothetical protein
LRCLRKTRIKMSLAVGMGDQSVQVSQRQMSHLDRKRQVLHCSIEDRSRRRVAKEMSLRKNLNWILVVGVEEEGGAEEEEVHTEIQASMEEEVFVDKGEVKEGKFRRGTHPQRQWMLHSSHRQLYDCNSQHSGRR